MKKKQNSFDQLKTSLIPLSICSFFLALLIQLCSLLPVYLMPKVIDLYIPSGNLKAILLSICAFCGIPLLTSISYTYYQYFLIKRGRKITSKLNLDCFEKILYQPMKFFDETYSAEIAKKCSQEAVSYVAVWSIDFPNLLSNVIVSIVIFWLLYQIHPSIAFSQLLYFPIILVISKIVGRKLEKLIKKVMEWNAKIQKYMQEAFHSIRILKSTQLEEFAVKRVEGAQKEVLNVWGKTILFDNLVGGVSTTFIPGILYGGTFILAAILVMNHQISLGFLTASLGYAAKIHNMFGNLLKTYNNYKKAKGECEAIITYLKMDDERDDQTDGTWSFNHEIVFSKVTFSYPKGNRNILQQQTMTFPKGKWIGITGPSGVGKTTILELLMRFYDIQNGFITIDETPIQKINLTQLRSHIAYVPQDPYLIDGTIEDNLKLVCKTEKKKEIERVAKLTGITDHIEGGLKKEIGEGGMLLSGGEKQRVAIAQCILKERPVILLDEVTSQLDDESQKSIAHIFKEMCIKEGTTIISVAHREKFNYYADMKYVMTK